MKRSTIEWHRKFGDFHPDMVDHLGCSITDAEFLERVGRIKGQTQEVWSSHIVYI